MHTPLELLEKYFEKYDPLELVSTLGGLQLCQENHSQILRLETASRIACKTKNFRNESIDPIDFSLNLNTYLHSNGGIGILEDPPEGLFTDNIMFGQSNYTVYSGLSHTEPLCVQNLLNVIFLLKDEFPEKFHAFIYFGAISLLSLSNELANRNGQYRYMSSPDRWRKDIKVPASEGLHELSKTTIFTKEKIEEIEDIDYHMFIPFILPFGHQNFNNEDISKNPLFKTPLIKISNDIVIANPGTIAGTLRHFILITSQQFGVTDFLLENLKSKIWFDVNEYLRWMSFQKIDLDIPSLEESLPFDEDVFKIDNDKLAYVLLITDDLTDYDINEPFGTWDSSDYSKLASERCEFMVNWLKGNVSDCNEVLVLVIYGQIGRYGTICINELPEYSQTILMTYEELGVAAKTRECDNLTLWKYAKVQDSINNSVFASFLDKYVFYVNNNHSFYISDDFEPSSISISIPELGKSLRIKVANLWDTHSAVHFDNPNAKVNRLDENIPIYYYEITHERLIEGYHQPIWVGIIDEIYEKPELRSLSWDVTSSISYWLWQLTPNLKLHLEPLGFNPIRIIIDLEDPENWMFGDFEESTETPNLEFEVNDQTIQYKIPEGIFFIMNQTDNTADRLIIDGILKAFGILLENHGLTNNLNDLERQHILDIHAPLGMKKHFLLINATNNISLNPQYIPELRKLQEHDIEKNLDGLVDNLGDKTPPLGEILDKEAKVELCGNIVDVYYENLKTTLSEFNWKSVLEKLVGNNEAICNIRANESLKTAPVLGCYLDIPSKVEKDIIEVMEVERTALTTRALIEIIAAEPPNGVHEITMEALDNILAITYHIINWAMLSDDIYFDLYDIDLKILRSGRVGVNRKGMSDTWDPFMRSKTLENVETNLDNFKFIYKPEHKPDESLKEELDQAFKVEFGLTLTQMIQFNDILIRIAFEQESSAPSILMSELKLRIIAELEWTDVEFNNSLDIFALKQRNKWEVPPNGFETTDIWPWRYNRSLSFLRRPIIICSEPDDDPLIYWGPRHVEEAERNLVNLVISGQYQVNESTPREMKELVGKQINDRGKKFTNSVKEWFEENTEFDIYSEVPIAPRRALKANLDLGDIDVLVIDNENKNIFSIECKHIFYGRNPREIKNELEKFIGEKDESDSWITKHSKRDKWLNENTHKLISAYGLKSNEFQVFSIFVTVREIPITYIQDMSLPFISYTRLKRDGINSLYEVLGLD